MGRILPSCSGDEGLLRQRRKAAGEGISCGVFVVLFLLCFRLSVYAQDARTFIGKAYFRNEISYSDALFYEIQSFVSPEKLPAKFKGGKLSEPSRAFTLLLRDAKLNWNNFTETQKVFLSSVFARPTDNGDQFQYQSSEATPYCTTHFCVHYVTAEGQYGDAPPLTDTSPANGIPDYVEFMGQEFETVYNVENGAEPSGLAYNVPPSDGSAGGNSKFDVYIVNIGVYGMYGFSAPETQVSSNPVQYTSYMAMDDDYSSSEFPTYNGDYTKPLRVTAAHEYHHAIQFGYFANGPSWFLESTATWAEDEVYDSINDNWLYMTKWFKYPYVSLDTDRNTGYPSPDSNDKLHVYGTWIFERYLSEKYGKSLVRKMWETAGPSCTGSVSDSASNLLCALNAGDTVLQQNTGKTLAAVFADFASRNYVKVGSDSIYEEGASYPTMTMTKVHATYPVSTQSLTLDHMAADYIQFTATDTQSSTLVITFNGPDGKDFSAKIIKETSSGTKTEDEISLNSSTKDGTYTVSDFGSTYSKVILTATNATKQDDGLVYTYSASVSTIPTIPSAPTGVSAIGGSGKVTVSWAAVSGAASYNLYMASQTGVTKLNYAALAEGMKHEGVTSSYAHTDLTNGKTYYFVVTAVNALGESADSSEVSAKVETSFTFTVPKGISMVSVPLSLSSASAPSVFGNEFMNFARWNAQEGVYYTYGNNPSSSNLSIKAGNGYWVKLSADKNVTVSGDIVSTSQNYEVSIFPGWNQIANPFTQIYPWTEVYVKYAGQSKKLADANAAKWVGSYAWSYPSQAFGYQLTHADMEGASRYLQPFSGYWMYSAIQGTLQFLPEKLVSSSTAKDVADNVPSSLVSVQMKASTGSASDEGNYFGVSKARGDDTVQKPPEALERGVSAYFVSDGRHNAADFRGNSSQKEQLWDFIVECEGAQNVTLTWDVKALPVHSKLFLQDTLSGQVVDMTQQTSAVVSVSGEKTLKIKYYKASALVESSADAASLFASKPYVYPNPDKTGNATFRYLTSPSVMRVSVEVYNLAGKLIEKFDGNLNGETKWLFGDTVAAGVYFFRITAYTSDNKEAVTGKLVVLR